MKIYEYIPKKVLPDEERVIALGFFDGVHAAHRRLLQTAKTLAEKKGLCFAVFTFSSESQDIKTKGRLYSTDEKLEIFENLGVDTVILSDFSKISGISAEDFVNGSLLCDMNCKAVVAGYDFRFGKGALGDADLLSRLISKSGAECVIEPEYKISGEKVSTTKIKEFLRDGRPDLAKEFLGAPYFIKSKVKHGLGLGAKLGFPTANSDLPENTVIKRGVYRTAVAIGNRLYHGITNVGICPTFGERVLHAETYIIDYSDNLYEENLQIFFLGFLREEKRFESKKDLILQINVDKNTAIKENGVLTWQEIGLN